MSKKPLPSRVQKPRSLSFFTLVLSVFLWITFGGGAGALTVFMARFSPALHWDAEFRLALIHGATLGALCQFFILFVFFFSDTFILFKYLRIRSRNSTPPFAPTGALKILLDQIWFESAQSKRMPRIRIFPSSKVIQMRVRAPFRNGEWWISTGYLLKQSDSKIQEDFCQVLKEIPRLDCVIQTWAACIALFWALIGATLCGAELPAISSFTRSRTSELTPYLQTSWGYIPAVISLSMIHLIKSWVQSPESNTTLDFNVFDVIEASPVGSPKGRLSA